MYYLIQSLQQSYALLSFLIQGDKGNEVRIIIQGNTGSQEYRQYSNPSTLTPESMLLIRVHASLKTKGWVWSIMTASYYTQLYLSGSMRTEGGICHFKAFIN